MWRRQLRQEECRLYGKVKMFVIQYSIFVNDDSLLNGVLQFPNIPIPRMLAQLVLCGRGKNDISFVILLTETVDKPFGKGIISSFLSRKGGISIWMVFILYNKSS